MELTKGANAPVPSNKIHVVLSWSGSADVDVAALLCTAEGKVRSDDDFIFYNQPRHRTDAVVHTGKVAGPSSSDTLTVDLDAVETDINKIVITGSVHTGNFGQLSSLAIDVRESATGKQLLQFVIPGATVETAMIGGELYRRNGVWKFRAVGQGYASGLRGVATDYGITVEGDDLSQDDASYATTSSTTAAVSYPPPNGLNLHASFPAA